MHVVYSGPMLEELSAASFSLPKDEYAAFMAKLQQSNRDPKKVPFSEFVAACPGRRIPPPDCLSAAWRAWYEKWSRHAGVTGVPLFTERAESVFNFTLSSILHGLFTGTAMGSYNY